MAKVKTDKVKTYHRSKNVNRFYTLLNDMNDLSKIWASQQVKESKKGYIQYLKSLLNKTNGNNPINITVSLKPKINKLSLAFTKGKVKAICLFPIRAYSYPIKQIHIADPKLMDAELLKSYQDNFNITTKKIADEISKQTKVASKSAEKNDLVELKNALYKMTAAVEHLIEKQG